MIKTQNIEAVVEALNDWLGDFVKQDLGKIDVEELRTAIHTKMPQQGRDLGM